MAAVRNPLISVTSLKPFEVNPDKFVSGCLNGLPYFSAKIVTLRRAICRLPLSRQYQAMRRYFVGIKPATCRANFFATSSEWADHFNKLVSFSKKNHRPVVTAAVPQPVTFVAKPVHTENPIRLLDACTYKISS